MIEPKVENRALLEGIVQAHDACYSEYMECPWCWGHVGHGAERHDEGCLWLKCVQLQEEMEMNDELLIVESASIEDVLIVLIKENGYAEVELILQTLVRLQDDED